MVLAQLRGAIFKADQDRSMSPEDHASVDTASQALADVTEWLGFNQPERGYNSEYLRLLSHEEVRIFKRATY